MKNNTYRSLSVVLVLLLLLSTASYALADQNMGSRTLRYGMSGEDVAVLQEFLINNSYPLRSATGYFGVKTLEAVKQFQRDNQLIADGIVGRNTFAVIFRIIDSSKGSSVKYVVSRGDTLYLIAQKYKTTVTAIQQANNLNGTMIYVGQVLVIPSGQNPPVVQPPSQPPADSSLTYQVRPGDTLYLISKKHNITVLELKNANGLTGDTIYPGQVLKIPGNQTPPSQPPSTPPPVDPPLQLYAEVVTGRDSVDIRTGADLGQPILISMVKGVRLAVESVSGNWYEVRLYNGKKGWVHRDDVTGRTPDTKPARSVMGFYTDDEENLIGSYSTMLAWNDTISSIAPFWFQINEQNSSSLKPFGNFTRENAQKTIKEAHRRNIKVLAVVHNLLYPTGSNTSREVMGKLLATPESRKAFINNVMTVIEDYGFDGINLDTEYVNLSDRDKLPALLKELKAEFDPKGYILTISIPGKMSDDPNNSWSGPFDYAAIGQYADQVVVMMYLEHGYPGSPPGPISSIGFIEKILQFAVTKIPREKIVAAIPVFGSDFYLDGKDNSQLYLSYEQVMQRAQTYNATIIFDQDSQTPMFRYTNAAGQRREVWFDNAESIARKVDVINKWNLNGIALWRMGMEDPLSWNRISEKLTALK